jgi:hypothetical protein
MATQVIVLNPRRFFVWAHVKNPVYQGQEIQTKEVLGQIQISFSLYSKTWLI